MKIKRDSLLHAETSALLCVVLGLLLPWWSAGSIAILAGIGKELWDREHGGVPSWSDLFWDMIGVIVGVIITLV